VSARLCSSLFVALVACSGGNRPRAEPEPDPAARAVSAPAPEPAQPAPPAPVIPEREPTPEELPVPEDFAAEAARTITPANYRTQLTALEKELGAQK